MRHGTFRYETMMSHIEHRFGQGALLERLAKDHPEELVTEVMRAALEHGVVTPAEALEILRAGHFNWRETLILLASKSDREGWDAEAIVLEALNGQPH